MSQISQASAAKGAAGRVSGVNPDATTIRKITVPSDAALILTRGAIEAKLAEAPKPLQCSYKFAASIEELKYVARRLIHDDVRAMELQAPPGVGKTTRFPSYISALTTDRIVVLEPTAMLAQAQAANALASGKDARVLPVGEERTFRISAKPGLVFATPSSFLLYLRHMQLRARACSDSGVNLIVLHDECHENDASTYALRNLWGTYPQIRRYVKMSATTAGNSSESRQRHNSAQKLTVCRYPPIEECDISLSDTMPDGSACPWSAAVIPSRRTLMFVEDDVAATHLFGLYSKLVPTRLLRRNDPYEAYVKVSRALQNIPNMVVLVDSGYQTGYTFDAEVVIDFGVRRQSIDGGAGSLASKYRLVTESERRQRMERVGRFKPGTAYIPNEPARNVESILGPGEVGLAAAWYVLLGFREPAGLVDDADRLHAADVVALLESGLPWELWQRVAYEPAAKRVLAPRKNLQPDTSVAQGEPGRGQPTESSSTAECPVFQTRAQRDGNDPGARRVENELPEIKQETPLSRGITSDITKLLGDDRALLEMDRFVCVGDDRVSNLPSAYVLGLIGDGNAMCRWFRRELTSVAPAALSNVSCIDSVMRWAVWVAAWNYNVAAEVVNRQIDLSEGGPSRAAVLYATAGQPLCSELKKFLIEVYSIMTKHDPKSIYRAGGEYYIDMLWRGHYYDRSRLQWAGGTYQPSSQVYQQRSVRFAATGRLRDAPRLCSTVTASEYGKTDASGDGERFG